MTVRVDPDALRRFAQDCRSTARSLDALGVADVDAETSGALPGSLTQTAVAHAEQVVKAAGVVAGARHRQRRPDPGGRGQQGAAGT